MAWIEANSGFSVSMACDLRRFTSIREDATAYEELVSSTEVHANETDSLAEVSARLSHIPWPAVRAVTRPLGSSGNDG
jgi:hypothetical protein